MRLGGTVSEKTSEWRVQVYLPDKRRWVDVPTARGDRGFVMGYFYGVTDPRPNRAFRVMSPGGDVTFECKSTGAPKKEPPTTSLPGPAVCVPPSIEDELIDVGIALRLLATEPLVQREPVAPRHSERARKMLPAMNDDQIITALQNAFVNLERLEAVREERAELESCVEDLNDELTSKEAAMSDLEDQIEELKDEQGKLHELRDRMKAVGEQVDTHIDDTFGALEGLKSWVQDLMHLPGECGHKETT